MDLRPAGETLARFPKYSLHILPGCADLGTARRRWTTSLLVVEDVVVMFLSNSDVSESFIETLDQRKTSYCTIVH